MFLQRINEMSVENWAFLWQEAGEVDGVGEVVGEHNYLLNL